MDYNILKDVFEYAKVPQKDLGKLMGKSQEHISDLYVKNLNDISGRELTILSMICDLDFNSLIGIEEDYVLMDKEYVNKIIDFYQLDKKTVYELRKKVRIAVRETGIYTNTERNKARKNTKIIPKKNKY